MKDIFISQGKKYISARRASDISDYSSDYIGQLCRAEKLDCTMVGRSWFVTEESLHIHRAEVLHKEIYRNRVANFQGGRKSAISTKGDEFIKSEVELKVKQETVQVVIPAKAGIQNDDLGNKENSAQSFLVLTQKPNVSTELTTLDSRLRGNDNILDKPVVKPIVWKFTYVADNRPLLPELNKKTQTFLDQKITVIDKLKENKLKAIVSPIPVRAFARSSVPVSTPTYPTLARSIILRRVLSSVAIILIVFSFVGGAMFISKQPSRSVVAQNISANVFDAVQTVVKFFEDGYVQIQDQVLALFHKDKQVAVSHTPTIIPERQTSQGLAVVPSSGTVTGDEAIKNKIKDSFSDEVVVKPDQSGTVGVITPVFRNSKGTDFMYVLVPVKPDK